LAQLVHSRSICDGRFCVHAIEDIGRHKPHIIAIELIDTGEQVHGCARWLDDIVRELQAIHAVALAEAVRNTA
jgi:hypothetical protein